MSSLIYRVSLGFLFFQSIFFITIVGVLISVFNSRSKIEKRAIISYFTAYFFGIIAIASGILGLLHPNIRFIMDIIQVLSIALCGFSILFAAYVSKVNKVASWILFGFILILAASYFSVKSEVVDFTRVILAGISLLMSYFIITSFLARGGRLHRKVKLYWRKWVLILIGIIILIAGIFAAIQFITNETTGSKLIIYTWEEYFDESAIPNFEKEFGVNVTIVEYSESSEMIENINNGSRYDLIIVDDAAIQKLILADKLYLIKKNKIENFKNILPTILDKNYDPRNKYSIPYMWGTTGLLINPKFVNETEISWDLLWSSKYSGKIAMLTYPLDIISIASLYLTSEVIPVSELERINIEKFLKNQKPLLLGYFTESEIKDLFLSEDLYVAPIYSGEALGAISLNPELKYYIPKEGGIIWTDNFAIPKTTKNKKVAREFINYILRPEVSANLSNYLEYTTSNQEAFVLIDKELLNNPAFLPPLDIMSKLKYVSDYEIPEEDIGFEEEIIRRVKGNSV